MKTTYRLRNCDLIAYWYLVVQEEILDETDEYVDIHNR